MPNVVTGILPSADTSALRKSLADAGLSLDHLQVINADDLDRGARGSADSSLLIGNSGSGTGVPGISNTLGGTFSGFGNNGLEGMLSDLDIPDSQIGNYVEALERGSTVVAFFAHADTLDAAKTAFSGSGINKVAVF